MILKMRTSRTLRIKKEGLVFFLGGPARSFFVAVSSADERWGSRVPTGAIAAISVSLDQYLDVTGTARLRNRIGGFLG